MTTLDRAINCAFYAAIGVWMVVSGYFLLPEHFTPDWNRGLANSF
jgi:hypothetical protein